MEHSPAPAPAPKPQNSIVNIPVRLKLAELEELINTQLDGIIYQDDSFEDGDRIKIKAAKRENIQLDFGDSSITYQVPLSLDIQYKLGIMGTVGADADIALTLRTDYTIATDWSLTTHTELLSHHWFEKPRVQVIGMNLPVEKIANFFLNRSHEMLTKNIDNAIRENLDMRSYLQQAWTMMNEPLEASPEFKAWLLLYPQDMSMSPLQVKEEIIHTTITVEARPEVLFGERPPIEKVPPLPEFSYMQEIANFFKVQLNTVLPFGEAERIARENLVGETFEQGKRSVTVEALKLYGQEEMMIIDIELSGSYNGSVCLSGVPTYDYETQEIDIDNLDFKLNTSNILFKAGAWLFEGMIKRKIQTAVDQTLKETLINVTKQIEQQLKGFNPAPALHIVGNLKTLRLHNVYLTAEGFRVVVDVEGDMEVAVDGLTELKLME